MASTSMVFGELELAFTTDMEFRWNSEKTDGKYGGSFWHPVPPKGFYALGSIGSDQKFSSAGTDGNVAALCVKAADGTAVGAKGSPLARPTGYERIWRTKHMGGKYDGSCWRPLAPTGYVALGHVFGNSKDNEPDTDEIVCVRKDLVHLGYAADFIYSEKNTDANHKFSAWRIGCPDFEDETNGLIASLGFVGVESHEAPGSDTALWVLNLPFPTETVSSPEVPVLDGYDAPPAYTDPVTDRIVHVPFTAVNDKAAADSQGTPVTVGWQVANTPFYTVRRQANYACEIFQYNNGYDLPQTSSRETWVGVSTTTSDTYSTEFGMEVGVTTGVSLGIETKVSVKLSMSLGFSTTTSVTELTYEKYIYSLQVAPQSAGALYVAQYTLQVVRGDADETVVDSASARGFLVNSYYVTSYPAPETTSTDTVQAMSMAAPESELAAV